VSRTGNALRNTWRPSETRCQAKQEVQESEASGARVTQTNMICKGCPNFGKKTKTTLHNQVFRIVRIRGA